MVRPDNEIMENGMACLVREMGIVETERFISLILQHSGFDYTEWQRTQYDNMTPEEYSREAAEYAKKHPFTGKAVRV